MVLMTDIQVTTRLLLPHVEIFGSLLFDKQCYLSGKKLEHLRKLLITIMHNATGHFHSHLSPVVVYRNAVSFKRS